MLEIKPGQILGIIGGGQLGRMTAMAAAQMGIRVHIFTDKKNSPASEVSFKSTVADYSDKDALAKFAKSVDAVTFEFENIPYESVKSIEKHVAVRPGWKVLEICQNRIKEKDFLNKIGVKTAPYKEVSSLKELVKANSEIGPDSILKIIELGYDGKGQYVLDSSSDLEKIWKKADVKSAILEGKVNFVKEISVVLARSEDGVVMPYIPVENIHKNGILDVTIAPAKIDAKTSEKAWNIANKIINELEIIGILAVEMFLTKDGEILVNELAPRPHNSGHWTMDACITSQFEQLIRAVCGMPLASTDYHSRAIMKNLIGDDVKYWEEFAREPDTKIHIYGKKSTKPGRKMGHITHLIPESE